MLKRKINRRKKGNKISATKFVADIFYVINSAIEFLFLNY